SPCEPPFHRTAEGARAPLERATLGPQGGRDVAEILERLEANPLLVEVLGEPVAREHARGREGGAPVGVAVADEDDLAGREAAALAGVAADLARARVPPEHAPAVGPWIDAVGAHLEVQTLTRQDGLDQLR